MFIYDLCHIMLKSRMYILFWFFFVAFINIVHGKHPMWRHKKIIDIFSLLFFLMHHAFDIHIRVYATHDARWWIMYMYFVVILERSCFFFITCCEVALRPFQMHGSLLFQSGGSNFGFIRVEWLYTMFIHPKIWETRVEHVYRERCMAKKCSSHDRHWLDAAIWIWIHVNISYCLREFWYSHHRLPIHNARRVFGIEFSIQFSQQSCITW